MSLSVQQPTGGTLPIYGAIVATTLPPGMSIAQPTSGALQIMGAAVLGTLDENGNFIALGGEYDPVIYPITTDRGGTGIAGNPAATLSMGAHPIQLRTTGPTDVTFPLSGTLATLEDIPEYGDSVTLPDKGGTGVANNLASTLTVSGAFPLSVILTAPTTVTFPASGKLAVLTDIPAIPPPYVPPSTYPKDFGPYRNEDTNPTGVIRFVMNGRMFDLVVTDKGAEPV